MYETIHDSSLLGCDHVQFGTDCNLILTTMGNSNNIRLFFY
jgi:hypothetical protein